MKKIYSKPEIMFEDFTLSENIAGDCENKISNPTDGVCGYPSRNGEIFMDYITGCNYKQPDGYNDLCYHVPTEYSDLFNS